MNKAGNFLLLGSEQRCCSASTGDQVASRTRSVRPLQKCSSTASSSRSSSLAPAWTRRRLPVSAYCGSNELSCLHPGNVAPAGYSVHESTVLSGIKETRWGCAVVWARERKQRKHLRQSLAVTTTAGCDHGARPLKQAIT